jgi:hypothetical protein
MTTLSFIDASAMCPRECVYNKTFVLTVVPVIRRLLAA